MAVHIRLRPVLGDNKNGVAKPEHRIMYLTDPSKQGHSSEFVFDKIFDAGSTQDEVWVDVSLDEVLKL